MEHSNSMRQSSITLLSGFCLSFLYGMVFVLAYMMTADLVATRLSQETGSLLTVWGPPVLISLLAAIPCCGVILLVKNKLVVPVGFTFLAVYYLIFRVAVYRDYQGAELSFLIQMFRLYMLPPVVLGNFLGWGTYLLLRRQDRSKSLRKTMV